VEADEAGHVLGQVDAGLEVLRGDVFNTDLLAERQSDVNRVALTALVLQPRGDVT
jgi:hypothetical protein